MSIRRQGSGDASNLGDAGVVEPVPAYGDAQQGYSYYGDGVGNPLPQMGGLNVNNVVAGASGEQLPSYEGRSSGYEYRNAGRPPEKGYSSPQP